MSNFAVLFDIDGLMLDTERMAQIAWARALDERGFQLDDSNFLRLAGRTVQDAKSIMYDIFGPDFPFQQMFDIRQAYYNQDIEENGISIKSGLMELLAFLEANGITKAVASSTPCWFATHKLERVGMGGRFQAVVCGDMVARGKPAPDLFLEAARQIIFPAKNCVVLEDSEAGIVAAHAAGMLPVMIPDLKQPDPEVRALAYQVLPSLAEVIPLLDGFVRNGLP